MTNTDSPKPTPHFIPSAGRQVLYALTEDIAHAINHDLEELYTETLEALNDADYSEEARQQHLPREGTYKAGDRVAATITRVHESGLTDLIIHAPSRNYPLFNRLNAYGEGGYLYYNQLSHETPLVSAKDEVPAAVNPKEEDFPF